MIINHNMNALNAHKVWVQTLQDRKVNGKIKLRLRINRAGGTAGLQFLKRWGQIKAWKTSRNSQDGISMIQTAEGALNETHNILQRMRELAVQALTIQT